MARGETSAELHRAAQEREVNTVATWHGLITDMSAFPKAKELTLLWSARTREGGYELCANSTCHSFYAPLLFGSDPPSAYEARARECNQRGVARDAHASEEEGSSSPKS